MRRVCFALMVMTLAFALATLVSAAKPAANTATPVTSTLHGGPVQPDAMAVNNRILSDGNGAYINGASGVVSVLQPVGDWELDASASSFRRIVLDFRHRAGTQTAPFDLVTVGGRIISKCFQAGSYRAMSAGSSQDCTIAISFTHADARYRLVMNSNFPGLQLAQVSCEASDASGCSAWRVLPVGVNPANGEAANVAKLLLLTTVKGKEVQTDLGNYYMSFEFAIVR